MSLQDELAAALNILVGHMDSIIEDGVSRDMPMGNSAEDRKARAAFYASEIQRAADELDGDLAWSRALLNKYRKAKP